MDKVKTCHTIYLTQYVEQFLLDRPLNYEEI